MQELDEIDREILDLLLENSRRPYSDIADSVGLSAPAVSDRVANLQEQGVIQRFTLRLDQSPLVEDSVPVLACLQPRPHMVEDTMSILRDNTRIEQLFTTADGASMSPQVFVLLKVRQCSWTVLKTVPSTSIESGSSLNRHGIHGSRIRPATMSVLNVGAGNRRRTLHEKRRRTLRLLLFHVQISRFGKRNDEVVTPCTDA